MKPSRQLLGQNGEQAAVDYLLKNDYRILSRNYRYSRSEIDIIAINNNTIVFVEVKSYRSKPLEAAEFRVNTKKQRQIIQGAYGFLYENIGYEKMDVRFDVIIIDFSVYPADITHHQAAFWLDEPF